MTDSSVSLWKHIKNTLRLKWIIPLLMVPVLFTASSIVETWLQKSGLVPYTPVGRRAALSVWRIVMLTGMVGSPLASLYLGEVWKKGKNSGAGLSGYFFGSIASIFLLITAAMVLNTLGLLIPLGVSYATILPLIFSKCVVAVLWVVAAATLCSSMTTGPGGAVLSFGLFSVALFPGLSGSPLSWWVIAPLGTMSSSPDSLTVVLAVAGHAVVYFAAGFFLLGRTTR